MPPTVLVVRPGRKSGSRLRTVDRLGAAAFGTFDSAVVKRECQLPVDTHTQRPYARFVSGSSMSGLSLADLASLVEAGGEGAPPDSRDEVMLIRHADALVRCSHARLSELVSTARARGVSWQAIGEALGVTRQAAFKRFGTKDEGETMTEPTTDLLDRTSNVFANLDAGDYEAVRAHMTYACGRALTKRKLMGVRDQVRSDSGVLEACVDLTAQTADGSTTLGKFANRHLSNGAVVQATLRHEAGEWIGRVAYNGSGKITGILIAPPGSRDLPF